MKKYLLILSIACNVIFIGITIRHFILMPRKVVNNKISYFVNRNVMLNGLPKDSTDIIFLGDSQTEAFELSELFKDLRLKNRGIYYDTSFGVLNRANDIANGYPSKVFIEIGVNDLFGNVHPLDVYKNVLKTINIIHSKSPRTLIYIQSVLPGSNFDKAIETNRIALNKLYSQMGSIKNVYYIDLDGYFLLDNTLNPIYSVGDGVHLNAAGYFKWVSILTNYICHKHQRT